jgi:hypothetical protein
MAPHLSFNQISELFGLLPQMRNEFERAVAFHDLGRSLTSDLSDQSLPYAMSFKSQDCRIVALSAIYPSLTPDLRLRVHKLILKLVQTLCSGDKSHSIIRAVPYLPADVLVDAMIFTAGIKHPLERARVFAKIASRLSPQLLVTGFDKARESKGPTSTLHEILKCEPATVISRWAQAVFAALSVIQWGEDEEDELSNDLRVVTPFFPRGFLSRVLFPLLDPKRPIAEEFDRWIIIAELSPFLSQDVAPAALAFARTITSDLILRSRALSYVCPHLSDRTQETVVQEVLTAAQDCLERGADSWSLTTIVSNLAPCLPSFQSAVVVQQVIDMLVSSPLRALHEGAFTKVASSLSPVHLEYLFSSVQHVSAHYPQILVALAPFLSFERRLEILSTLQEFAKETYMRPSKRRYLVESLCKLIPTLPEVQQAEATERALLQARLGLYFERDDWYIDQQKELFPFVSGDHQARLLDDMLKPLVSVDYNFFADHENKATSSFMPPNHLEPSARDLKTRQDNLRQLAILYISMAQGPRSDACMIWNKLLQFWGGRPRWLVMEDLRTLSPFASTIWDEAIAQEIGSAILDVGRWWSEGPKTYSWVKKPRSQARPG